MKVKEAIILIENEGWFFKRQSGSHIIYNHPIKKGTVVIPNHVMNADRKIGTANSILKQAGLK